MSNWYEPFLGRSPKIKSRGSQVQGERYHHNVKGRVHGIFHKNGIRIGFRFNHVSGSQTKWCDDYGVSNKWCFI